MRRPDTAVTWITNVIHSWAKAGADAILFPECAVRGYESGQVENPLQPKSRLGCSERIG